MNRRHLLPLSRTLLALLLIVLAFYVAALLTRPREKGAARTEDFEAPDVGVPPLGGFSAKTG